MKKIGLIILIMVMVIITVQALTAANENSGIPANTFFVMDNGLGVFIQKRDAVPMVNIVLAVNIGSKDEDDKTNGLVHLLEHLLLLGPTELRSADEMNREMRRRGVLFNAHTSHDSMTFEVSLPARYWEFGLAVLEEKLFRCKFTQDQLDKEKEIIFEEISQHHDDPFLMGTQLALQLLFREHPYHYPIFGNPEVIKKAALEEIATFYRRYFIPANCALAIVGDVNPSQTGSTVKQVFGKLEKKERPQLSLKQVLPLKKNLKISEYLDIKEARMVFGFYAPSSDHPERISLELLKTILGRGINPLLGSALYQRGRPMTSNINMRYVTLDYGGALLIYITLDPKFVSQVQRELIKFFKTLWKFGFSPDDYEMSLRDNAVDYLTSAKSEIKFYYEQFQELGLNAAVSYAKFFLLNKDKVNEDQSPKEPYITRVEKITSSDLGDAASHYLSGEKYVLVTLLPGKKEEKKGRK